MILLIDNYDSFTFNLFQYIEELGYRCHVVRNDKISLDKIAKLKPRGIVLSPGPGRPENAGICLDVIRTFGAKTPLFGVCLGHQAIGHAFGAKVVKAPRMVHGKVSKIAHRKKGVFQGLPSPLPATRYHSLILKRESLPKELMVTAEFEGLVMGVKHRRFPIEGVQFHPESISTESGRPLLMNFLKRTGAA